MTAKKTALKEYLEENIVALCKEYDDIKSRHTDEYGGFTLEEPEWGNYKAALQVQNNRVLDEIKGILDEVYITRLRKIFELRSDYSIIDYLVIRSHEEDGDAGNIQVSLEAVEISDIKEAINHDVERLLFEEDCIYQGFTFHNDILNEFYRGDDYIGLNKDTTPEEGAEMLENAGGNLYAFMPDLVKKIEEIIGEGNFVYDGYCFGANDFGLYWLIHKSVYLEKLKMIGDWLKYEGWEKLVEYRVKSDEL